MKKKVLEGKGCREQQVLAQVVKHSPPQKRWNLLRGSQNQKLKKKDTMGDGKDQKPRTKTKQKTKNETVLGDPKT